MKEISEYEIQKACVKWFRYTYPDDIIFHIPNGEKRNIQSAIKLQNMGVTSGIPDLFVPKLNCFIEIKNSKGKLSNKQIKTIEKLRKTHLVYVKDSLESFKSIF